MTPDGWCRVDLSDVADQRIEKVVPVETDKRPYVALEHLAQGSPTLIGWSKAGTAASAKTVFCAGDVLFGKLRPYLRKAAPAPFDGLCSTDILPLFSKRTLDTRYLAQLAQWRPLQQHAVATSSGTKMPRTSWAQLGEFRFSLPPLPEQRKIAAILSSVDDAIEKTQAVIDQVQVVKRGLMQELLTRGLPGRHTRFKQTEIGEIAEEWEVVELASVATVERGKFAHRPRNHPRFYGGQHPFVQTGDVAACDGLITTYSQTLNEEGLAISKLFRTGTIIVTIAANIGATGIAAFDVAFPDSLVGIQAGPRIDTRFLELVLRTRKHDLDRAAPESAQKNINLNTLKPLRVPLPSMTEQTQIAECVWSIIMRQKHARFYRDSLTQLKSALMSVLLTGELRVTPDTEVA